MICSQRLPLALLFLAAAAAQTPVLAATAEPADAGAAPETATTVCRALGTASDFNAFFFGDFSAPSSDVEGRIAVQGKLNINNYSLADKLSAATAGTSVIVGGDFVFPSGRIYYGNSVVGGSAAGVGAPVRNGLTAGQTITDQTTLPLDFNSEKQRLIAYSNTLAALPANGTYTSQWGGLYLSGSGSASLQVFSLPGQLVLDAHTFQVSNIPAGATVLINVSGSSAGLTNMSLDSLATIRRKVLFNFPTATTLELAGIGVEGSILAPNAVINNPQGVVKGTVIGKSWSGIMQLNHEPFEGCGLPAMPPPACELYPIAIAASSVASAQIDQSFTNIVSGAGAGQFGWLTWAGSPSAPTLSTSLTPPGDSHTWRNPDAPSDAVMDPLDWIQGSPGQSNSSAMRAALDALLNREITVPAWSATRGQGNNFDYQVSRFIRIKLTAYDLKGNGNRLSFVYRGGATCGAGNSAPVITSTAQTTGTVGSAYSYDVNATDADNDPLTYTLVTKPTGMTINATTGLIAWTPATAGSNAVLVRVSDGKGGTVDQSFSITVTQANRAPVVTSTPVTTATTGTAYSYDVNATDADGDILTYTLVTKPTGMTINATTGLISWAPSAASSEAVLVRVSDGKGGSVDQSFSIAVTQTNRAPVITSTAVTTASTGSAYAYDVNATDADGDTLTYTLVSKPTDMTINATTGLIAWTPAAAGSNAVLVRVSDGKGGSVDQSFSITVTQSNRAPVITSTPVTTATTSTAYSYDVNATDADNDTLTYTLVTKPTGMTINATTGLISWTPTETQTGANPVEVRVTDNNGGSVDQSFSIAVTQSNRAPVITSTAVTTATTSAAYSYDVNATDADNDTLTYTLVTKPTGMTINATTGLISWTPAETQTGANPVEVRVTDNNGGSVDQSFSITVTQSNRAPVITSTAVTTATTNSAYSYDVNATDADNDTLTYTLLTKPTGMTIDASTGLISWTPIEAQIATHPVEIEVVDGRGGSTTQLYGLIVVQANRAPIALDGSLLAIEAQTSALLLRGSDPDGDVLSYSIVEAPAHGTLSGTAPNLNYTSTSGYAGPDQLRFKVSDGALESAIATVQISVQRANRAPQATAASVSVDEDSTVELTLTGTDPDGDPLNFEVLGQPAHGTLSGTGATRLYQPAADYNGADSFQFRVNDGLLQSAPAQISLTVVPVNDAPSITSTPGATVALDQTFTYPISATDPDGETVFSWRLIQGPAGAAIDAQGILRWTATATSRDPVAFVVQVRDAGGASDQQSFAVLVTSNVADASDLGREFWFGLSDNSTRFGVDYSDPIVSPKRRLYVVISGPQNTSGTVEVPGLSFSTPFTHSAGAATEVDLPPQTMHLGHGTTRNLGVHVSAALPVQVTVHNYDQYSGDAFRALPMQALSTRYTVIDQHSYFYTYFGGSFSKADFPGQFQIVATENGTSVMITPRRGAGLGMPNTTFDQPWTVVLNRGEALFLGSPTHPNTQTIIGQPMPSREYSGARIQSTRPISVTSGNSCAYLPDNGNACNHLVEQLLPDELLGVDHLTLSFARRLGGDLYRIVATADQTLLRIDGQLVAQLAAGQSFERRLSAGAHRIEGSKPISVAHFGLSQTVDNQTITPIGAFADPTMIQLPSRELWLKQVHFSTPAPFGSTGQYRFRSQHASVIVPTTALASLKLDGQSATLRDSSIIAGDYTAGYLDLQPGAHQLSADLPFGLEVYGWDNYDAFGFTGGIGVATSASQTIQVTPNEQTAEIGSRLCVSAKAVDAAGQAIAFAKLRISIAQEALRSSEPSFATDLIADANGRAQYCALGVEIRNERWAWTSGNASATARVIWTAPTRNQPPHIVSLPRLLLDGGALADQVIATDPNADVLLYSLTQAPVGMSIDANSGLLSYAPVTPVDRKPTRHAVTIRVRDPGGLEDTQSYELEVRYGPYLYVPDFNLMTGDPNLAANGVIVEDVTYGWRRAGPTGGSYFGLSSFGGRVESTQSRLVEGPPGMTYVGGDGSSFNSWRLQWNAGSVSNRDFASTEPHHRMCRRDNQLLPAMDAQARWTKTALDLDLPVFVATTDTNADGRIDQTDRLDAVGTSANAPLRVINLNDGSERWRTPFNVSPDAYPAAGDLNGDGVLELVGLRQTPRHLIALKLDGSLLWESASTFPSWIFATANAAIQVVDLDADGQPEIVAGPVVYSRTGVELWRFPDRSNPGGSFNALLPLIVDLDGDGRKEVLFADQARSATGAVVFDLAQRLNLSGQIFANFTAANLDSDPQPEILATLFTLGGTHRAYAMDSNGSLLWGPLALTAQSLPLVHDFDDDGQAEIYFPNSRKRFSTAGVELSAPSIPGSVIGAQLVDLDQDGSYEVLESGLRLIDPISGSVIRQYSTGTGSFEERLGLDHLIDYDHDGRSEIFRATYDAQMLEPTIGQWALPVATRTSILQRDAGMGLVSLRGSTANNLPDLWVSPAQIDRGTPGTLWAIVRNRGSKAITSPVSVQFWQGAPEQGGRSLGIVTLPSLAIGARQRVQVVATPEALIGWIRVQASIAGTPEECFSNNQSADSHQIRLETWDAPGTDRLDIFRFLMELWESNLDPSENYSTPVPRSIAVGQTLVHQSPATDSNRGDALTFYLNGVNNPQGMIIHPHTGEIRWTPRADQVGNWPAIRFFHKDLSGRAGEHRLDVTVLASSNRAPSISSTPGLSAAAAQPYVYDVDATDPDGDVLSYALSTAPVGMSIDAATGLIQWTPTAAQTGPHSISVRVTDAGALSATQTWTLTVAAAVNRPPVISSAPPVQGRQNAFYYYDVIASDPDGQALTYSVVHVPPVLQISQLAISNSGRMSVISGNAGTQKFRVRVSDGQLFTEQEWTVQFISADQPTIVQIELPNEFVPAGSLVPVRIAVSGTNGNFTRTLTVDGVDIPLDANGQANIPSGNPGTRTLQATLVDGSGTLTVVRGLHVADPADSAPPIVNLPLVWSGREITAPIEVRAQVEDVSLAYWRLLLQEHGGPSTELIRGSGTGPDLRLGMLDPTTLENGTYQLVVEAVDTTGRTSTSGAEILIDGNMKLGQFSLSFEDVSVPVLGIPVTLTRTYDTRVRNRNMDFGYGWSVDYQNVRIRESRTLGKSWRNDRPFGTLQNCLRANGIPMVSVTLPGGNTETFKPKLSRECQLVLLNPVELHFEPEGIDHGYKLEQMNYSLIEWNGDNMVEPGSVEPVDPSIYKLTTPDGMEYIIDQSFGIRTIKDLHGNTLTYSDAGVVHSTGVKLDFVRDAQHRITEVIQPDGQRYRYRYDARGDLVEMIDPVNGTEFTTRFEYLAGQHYLTKITGPNGYSTRNEYDAEGRLIKTIDAAGKIIEFNHVLSERREVVKDRLGNATTYLYDERGNVLSERNALGEITLRTYDIDDNVLTETNPLGETVTRTYDNFRNTLTETNALGETTTMTYDYRLNLASTRNPLGHTQSTVFRYRDNRFERMEDAMGRARP